MAHDVFISYSSKDKLIADAVCGRLEARGIRCWIAPRDVQPGLPYGEAIIDGIHNCSIMVLLLSSSANTSTHIPKEVERAVSRGATIIPLRIEDVAPAKSLDYFIGSVHWLDALTRPLERHLDNLADTILKILPSSEKGMPRPASTLPIPYAASRRKWLIPVIVGAVVVVVSGVAITALVFWSGRESGGENRNESRYETRYESRPDNRSDPGIGSRSGSGSGSRAASGFASDPLPGCWTWFNNAPMLIRSNGTMTAGPFTARWRLVDPTRHVYTFTWPEAVDTTILSPDGRTLAGGNQYGFQMSATRLSGGPGLAGSWRWFNGGVVSISNGGTFTVGNITGHWRGAGLSYSLTWPNPVDTVTLSADRTHLEGSNQYGVRISGTKTGVCGGS